ncbi:MAG: TIGR03067 domain-containing protein [Gemmataceae bacterium]
MRAAIGILLAIGLAFGIWFAYVRLQKEDDPFEGTWKVVYSEEDGDIVPPDDFQEMKIVFAGYDIEVFEPGRENTKFKYNAVKDQVEGPIDFVRLKVDRVEPGFFRFSGDRLMLIIQRDSNEKRPTDFRTWKDSGRWKVELVRKAA